MVCSPSDRKRSNITARNRDSDILPSCSISFDQVQYFSLLRVPSRGTLKKHVDYYAAVELHSGSGPMSFGAFPGSNGELRREKGNQTSVRISSVKSHVPVL